MKINTAWHDHYTTHKHMRTYTQINSQLLRPRANYLENPPKQTHRRTQLKRAYKVNDDQAFSLIHNNRGDMHAAHVLVIRPWISVCNFWPFDINCFKRRKANNIYMKPVIIFSSFTHHREPKRHNRNLWRMGLLFCRKMSNIYFFLLYWLSAVLRVYLFHCKKKWMLLFFSMTCNLSMHLHDLLR